MATKQQIVTFDPGVYIQLNDTFTGRRKMARVSETGVSYYDLDSDDATPFPIYESLDPTEVGNILGWGLHIVDNTPEKTEDFRQLVERLINAGVDVLTYNRAAYWAFENKIYDFEKALAAGQSETNAITEGRAKMDAIIATAGASNEL